MTERLKTIHDPADIRGLPIEDLKELCAEIREEILRVMARNSGHLASSLGAVELATALHYVYNTPEDRLVWDVGHQAYPHKILTGRFDRFETIRQDGGLSGFLRRAESPYDTFGAGHASTSISAALGMAIARDHQGLDHRVVSITGDGAMTGGPCYEGLNNAGQLGTDLLVILNDNEMSISRNVGAISRYFNKIVTTQAYNKRHKEIGEFIKRLPAGESVARFGNRIEEAVKGLIVPGLFFEELGFRYLGPIDGHDLDVLVPTLEKVRNLKGPILLHVLTVKGKGREYSEADPIRWHSPPYLGFDLATGDKTAPAPSPGAASLPSLSAVFVDTLRECAREDDKLVAITAAMLEGTALTRFEEEFPERTFDVGIAEAHAVMSAAGMACDGLNPWVCIYSTFLQRAIDSVIHDVGIQDLPVKFSLDRGGLVGADGPTHHGVFDFAYMRMIPGIVVMAPMDAAELRHMTYTAHRYMAGPISLRFARGKAEATANLEEPLRELPIGKGEVLREGGDACLIGIGSMTLHALRAAELLATEGVEVGVVNARFVKPLDTELLARLAAQYPVLITVEDHVRMGGFGSAVNEALAEMGAAQHAVVLGVPDRFISHGAQDRLYHECGLSPEAIAQTVRDQLQARDAPAPRSRRSRRTDATPAEPALAAAATKTPNR
jgi:1-deoxy-D-xylulose-5-phosphate synthase